jgi:ABC-type glycerol-3-phosphate transport system substrate-binding protein
MEVDKDVKSIQFNKPEFVDAMQKFIQAWKDGYDTTGTSWDDSNNNRAFLSEQICCSYNGSSIYYAAKKDKPESPGYHHADPERCPAAFTGWAPERSPSSRTPRTSQGRRSS